MTAVQDVMADDLARQAPEGLEPLTRALLGRYPDQILAILLYGSCRRDKDIHDGLVDLLVVVDNYRAAYRNGTAVALNWLLPPNVYFLQVETRSGPLRCKFAVITLGQFQRRCQSFSDHYFWARFTQPSGWCSAKIQIGLNPLLPKPGRTLQGNTANESCRCAPPRWNRMIFGSAP